MAYLPRWYAPTLASLCFSTFMLCATAQPISAHPHVFIENRVKAVVETGKLIGFFLNWHFDDLSSTGFLRRSPSIGPLNEQEVAQLKQHAFSHLHTYGYFVHLWQGNHPIPSGQAEGFTAHLDGDNLIYHFFLRLTAPLNIRHEAVTADFYDETYYTDLSFPEGDAHPVSMAGKPEGCTFDQLEDKEHPINSTGFAPPGVRIVCE